MCIRDILLSIAKDRLCEYPKERLNFKYGSINNSGLKENSFDFVICRFVSVSYTHLDVYKRQSEYSISIYSNYSFY